MLDAQPTQLKLADDGRILYQLHPTNPLPGEAVAKIRKGTGPLSPEIDVIDAALAGVDKAAAKDFLTAWLKQHIGSVLETLKALEDTDALAGPGRGICYQVYEAMGIVPRENLEDLIKDLDSEMRQSLRTKQVRLGPVLVFLPALNKPAAVRLRGLLWSLWNDRAVPAPGMPPDGAVSIRIDPKAVDRRFYQAIGYPVYATRAIRIDMLDRVISAVYDGASEGKFRAEHKMAEWLGCGIEDLYEILSAMGHRKIEEPVRTEAVPEAAVEAEQTPEPAGEEIKAQPSKPVLAQFWLKKGKAFEKPAHKKGNERDRAEYKKKKPSGRDNGRDKEPKIMSARVESRPEDSPFAILQQLKAKKDAAGS